MKRTLLAAAAVFCLAACKGTPETVDLFNGKDLTGWEFVAESDSIPTSQLFKAEDGVIKIAGQPIGYMYTAGKYSDFKLEVEYRWPDGPGNSGVFLLIDDVKNPFPNGIECQLCAQKAGDFVLLGGSNLKEYVEPEGGRPQFPKIEKMQPSSENADGEWNKVEITVRNGHISVVVNGVLQNEATDPNKCGHIGLQSEGFKVEFRSVRLTPLK